MLREAGFADAARDIDQSREGGGDVRVPPYLFEVKRYAKFSMYAHMDQAVDSAERHGLRPVVAWRGDNRGWMVTLPAADFLRLMALEAIYGNGNS